MITVTLHHFVLVSFGLMAAGVACMVTKRNAIGILMGVELVLNAAALNFVAFNRFHPWDPTGQAPLDGFMFAMFIIVLAAAEAAIALAIILNLYNNLASVDVDKAREMRG